MQSKSKDNRPVFAAYLNMARQNAFETLCHISKLKGISVLCFLVCIRRIGVL